MGNPGKQAGSWQTGAVLDRSERLLLSFNPETLIAAARLAAAMLAIIAIYLDPTNPAGLRRGSQIALGFYAAFALAFVLFPLKWPLRSRSHLLIHAIDAIALGWLAYRSEELTSPFVSTLPFIMFAMTFRWGLRGAIGAAVILECALSLLAWPDLQDGVSELNVFIMRSASYAVGALMIGYLGAYRERSRDRLVGLADWPSEICATDSDEWLERLLRRAANVLGYPTIIVLWRDQEQSVGNVAILSTVGLRRIAVEDRAFWIHHDPEHGSDGRPRAALEKLLKEFPQNPVQIGGMRNWPVRTATFSSVRYRGRIFTIDPTDVADENNALLEIVVKRIGTELEHIALIGDIAETARTQERARLSRDLHDSVLQELTAAGLKLKLFTDRNSGEDHTALHDVSAIIGNQQCRIREIVESSRAGPQSATAALLPILQDRTVELGNEWCCEISLSVTPPTLRVATWVLNEINQIISEATANAVRHGRATRLDVSVNSTEGSLAISIADNGTGMSASTALPLSLSTRVSELGGLLDTQSGRTGLGLSIRLPFAAEACA